MIDKDVLTPEITVLMSTYNGHDYLREQLDSIMAQKDVIVHLCVRDDGSSDDTRDILELFKTELEKKSSAMTMTVEYGQNKGAKESFFDLMFNHKNADFIALSDQDDVWDDDKLISAIRFMQMHSNVKEEPVLYTGNLRLVDRNLRFIRKNREYAPNINEYNSFFELWCTGCTTVYNRKMADLICHHRPRNVEMHDSWEGFIGYQMGKVLYDITPHISYRQHGDNVMGVNLEKNKIKKTLKSIVSSYRQLHEENRITVEKRTKEYIHFYKDILSKEQLNRAIEVGYYKKSWWTRLRLFNDRRFSIRPKSHDLNYRMFILLGKL